MWNLGLMPIQADENDRCMKVMQQKDCMSSGDGSEQQLACNIQPVLSTPETCGVFEDKK